MRFTGQVALVTGAGSGIGRAVAGALATEGATVVIAGRTKETLAGTAAAIGPAADPIVADVTDEGSVADLVRAVVARHGRLDVAVNNVGTVGPTGPLTDIPLDAWTDVLTTNVTGVFLSLKHEVAHMRAHGGGAIVNVASNIGAHLRLPGMAPYAATKAAVSALTRAAALEAIADGVRINAVSPGPADTPMSLRPGETPADRATRLRTALPIGRVADLSEVAAAILWLAADESSYAVGHDLVLDGGATA